MYYIILGAFIALLLAIVLKVFYKLWFQSKLVMVKDDIKSENVKDYIIFEYDFGGYMGMVNLSISVLTKNYDMYGGNCRTYFGDGNEEEIKKRNFYIGYEAEANSGKFFVYGTMNHKDGKLKFSTFFGKNPCRFIIFTDETSMAFIPNNKKISIIDNAEKVDYIYSPWFWQKWGEKIFSRIRIDEDNKLVPYGYYSKNWNVIGINEGFDRGNFPSPLPWDKISGLFYFSYLLIQVNCLFA